MKVATLSAPFLALLSSISVTIATPLLDSTVVDKDAAPLVSSTAAADLQISNNYIVVFKNHVDGPKAKHHQSWVTDLHKTTVGQLRKRSQSPFFSSPSSWIDEIESLVGLKHTFDIGGVMMGYSGAFDNTVLSKIRKHPDVAYVEKDSIVNAYREPKTQHSAPWGLARASHRKRLTFGTFNKYIHQTNGGEGVDVYVIDTGVHIKHVDFGDRAFWLKTVPFGDENEDGNGHGTHCAGTIAGTKYGMAKKAHVHAIKVLRSNGSGTMSDVVKGVEVAVTSHTQRSKKAKDRFKGSAANMSLGGGKSPALDLAVNAAVKAGIHFAVAAGNDNTDACDYSPAASELSVTVGASTLSDDRAYFSNYGECTDIFAPGLNIESTWIGSNNAINTISGTSMAAPHVAGLMAYFLSLQPDKWSGFYTELTPSQLKKNMIAIGSQNCLDDIPDKTPNVLIYNGGGTGNLTEIFDGKRYVADQTVDNKNKLDVETPVQFDDLEHAVL